MKARCPEGFVRYKKIPCKTKVLQGKNGRASWTLLEPTSNSSWLDQAPTARPSLAPLRPPPFAPLARPCLCTPCAKPLKPPLGAALRAATLDPRSASRRSGYAMPALLPRAIASAPSRRVAPLGTPPRLRPRPRRSRGWARPAHGAGHLAAVIPTHFVVGIHGWTRVELARLRSLASASVETPSATHADLCPPSAGRAARVKIGGVLRGVLPRSSARV